MLIDRITLVPSNKRPPNAVQRFLVNGKTSKDSQSRGQNTHTEPYKFTVSRIISHKSSENDLWNELRCYDYYQSMTFWNLQSAYRNNFYIATKRKRHAFINLGKIGRTATTTVQHHAGLELVLRTTICITIISRFLFVAPN